MNDFDLKSYLKLFPSICVLKFGRAYDFEMLEKQLAPLRNGIRTLAASDVLSIFDPNLTPFARYWIVPNRKELEQSLQHKNLSLGPTLFDPRQLLSNLLDVFSNLFVASLVMRFVYPDHYGTSSTPVINLLQVHRSTTIEAYFAFIEELKVWKEHFEMPSIAQTEMALWAYDQIVKGIKGHADKARQEFEEDIWCQRRRVAQIVGPFLRNHGKLQLARILASEDPKLAGKIAGEEYERLLNCASRKYFRCPLKNRKGEAEKLIGNLEKYAHISLIEKSELDDIWEIRCKAVHPDGQPEEHEVENIVDKITRICLPWEPIPTKKK